MFVIALHPSCSDSYFFFFFKQKTAYEMRISDWSSDVCSSDLPPRSRLARAQRSDAGEPRRQRRPAQCRRLHGRGRRRPLWRRSGAGRGRGAAVPPPRPPPRFHHTERLWHAERHDRGRHRSEEHTSELQSLMRISYAVFCLKKKTTEKTRTKPTKELTRTQQT